MKTLLTICAVVTIILAISGAAQADMFGTGGNQFTIAFVPISGSTNPTSGYGIVNRDYRMGTYEITNDQWNKFAASLSVPVTGSPANAYNKTSPFSGTNVPTGTSWYEAAQFVNWLNTSTGHQAAYKFTGTQGTSDYTLALWSAEEAAGADLIYRHKDAFYYLPSEAEWAKAAYWSGTAYQTYANASAGDLVAGLPDPVKWNYAPSEGSVPWVVGYGGTAELNGTYDMMGNVKEWTESLYQYPNQGQTITRTVRGGAYNLDYTYLMSDNLGRIGTEPSSNFSETTGFRVASVPEPATICLLGLGALSLLRRKRNA